MAGFRVLIVELRPLHAYRLLHVAHQLPDLCMLLSEQLNPFMVRPQDPLETVQGFRIRHFPYAAHEVVCVGYDLLFPGQRQIILGRQSQPHGFRRGDPGTDMAFDDQKELLRKIPGNVRSLHRLRHGRYRGSWTGRYRGTVRPTGPVLVDGVFARPAMARASIATLWQWATTSGAQPAFTRTSTSRISPGIIP